MAVVGSAVNAFRVVQAPKQEKAGLLQPAFLTSGSQRPPALLSSVRGDIVMPYALAT